MLKMLYLLTFCADAPSEDGALHAKVKVITNMLRSLRSFNAGYMREELILLPVTLRGAAYECTHVQMRMHIRTLMSSRVSVQTSRCIVDMPVAICRPYIYGCEHVCTDVWYTHVDSHAYIHVNTRMSIHRSIHTVARLCEHVSIPHHILTCTLESLWT